MEAGEENSSAGSPLMAGILVPWIPPLLPAGQTGGVGACCYFTSLAFMGVGLSSYRTNLPGTLMKAMVHSRPFQGILSDTEPPSHNMLPGSLAAHFSLISLQLGTISPPPTPPHPHSNQPQTSKIRPFGEGVGPGWKSASLSILSDLAPAHPITRLVIAEVMSPCRISFIS